MARNERNRRLNRRLRRALVELGFEPWMRVETTRDGKRVEVRMHFDYPPHIDDRVIYGDVPTYTIFEIGPDGYSVTNAPQRITATPSGPESVRYDHERPEILEFIVNQMQDIRHRLQTLGATECELDSVHLTRPLPPVHLSFVGEEDARRRATQEEIDALLSDPGVDDFVKQWFGPTWKPSLITSGWAGPPSPTSAGG